MAPLDPSGSNVWSGVPEGDVLQAALRQGFVTHHDLEKARSAQQREARRDRYRSLAELLIEMQSLTAAQLDRIAQELNELLRIDPIPGYRFLEKVGEGSMGVVYKAEQRSLNRIVAVKILSRHFSRNKDYINRLEREARLGSQLASSHIPQVHDRGVAAGQHYVVMEYVDGDSIGQLLQWGNSFGSAKALEVGLQAAEALEYLHGHGVVHRDVKPANLVITRDGVIKLMDLGLARRMDDQQHIRLEGGNAIGTPYYISPEQLLGSPNVDGRSDLYSLGATLYHMVTGRPPFDVGETPEILQARLSQDPEPPETTRGRLWPELNRMILKLLARNRVDRYSSAEHLVDDMQRLRVLREGDQLRRLKPAGRSGIHAP